MNSPKRSFLRPDGRVLFVTDDPQKLKDQFNGTDLSETPEDLAENISTDEITPGWVCFWYDETLGRYSHVGFRSGAIQKDDIKNGGFQIIVSGASKGIGSSRETAPYSEKTAGIQLVIAKSFEKIYHQNAQNIGLLLSTDFSLIQRLRAGEDIPIEEFTRGLDPIAKAIVEYGGLFEYNKARLKKEIAPDLPHTPSRPMTAVEKIIAAHTLTDAQKDTTGVEAVEPGQAYFCRTDIRFSHEYVTPMAEALFKEGFGEDAKVKEPESVFAFRDHLTFLKDVMPEERVKMGLLAQAEKLATVQEDFTKRQGVKLYGEDPEGGSYAICHNAVLDEIALPGQLVLGTDSHTCTAGALGCFAFGVGSTDMANAWLTRDVRITTPKTVRVHLSGTLPSGVSAKDAILALMATDFIRSGGAIAKVLEFYGEGITAMSVDERATLTNMAVEAGATTGFVAADDKTIDFLKERRGLDPEKARAMAVFSDEDSIFDHELELDLSALTPVVARPGDPRNGVFLSELKEKVKIDIAYGGSCTGGKRADMDSYASILGPAFQKGLRVAEGVELFIQFGSQDIKEYARQKGYIEIFEGVGATLIAPSCGACINAGPGVSNNPDQVTISAINRNFPGRSGPGKVWLAGPLVIAASAIAGEIIAPDELFERYSLKDL
ncbi:3-isopropylmalate dehydratase [Myxococcota bacterium]|nr:3-isopropylmalate dehydratase [Myxococcota bacterium]